MTSAAPITNPATSRVLDAPLAEAPTRDTELAIEGMTCAACAVRIEKKLNRLDHVRASVNYATGIARVTGPATVPTEELIAAVVRAGYTATASAGEPEAGEEDQPAGDADARRAAYLKRRLIVSLVLFIPLTDLSMMLSLVPSLRFPG